MRDNTPRRLVDGRGPGAMSPKCIFCSAPRSVCRAGDSSAKAMHLLSAVHAMPIMSVALVIFVCKVDAVAALVAAGADTTKTNEEL